MCNQDDKHARSFDDKPADSVVADATDQTVESTEETVALNELFAEAEGYTPLADVHMNALAGAMFMAMPPTVEGDTGCFFADMNAFPSASYATITQYDNDDEDSDSENDTSTLNEFIDISLAEQALKTLDEDYFMTVRGHIPDLSDPRPTVDDTEPLNGKTVSSADSTTNDDDNENTSHEDAVFEEFNPATSALLTQPRILLPKKDLPPIDTEAVKRAVAAIQLKAPKLDSNLDKWQQQCCDVPVPKEHPIIPQTPLSAFRKVSDKAKQATANLSRAATIADALARCACLKGQDELRVHVIGADHVECGSEFILRTFFRPLVRWIGALDCLVPRSIVIHLIGPNVTNSVSSPVDLMPLSKLKKSSPLTFASATCHTASYHEWITNNTQVPDLLVAFNAGIWGYREWRPTLEALCRLPWTSNIVVTSYTIQEGEDDADVISDIVTENGSTSGNNKCLWTVRPNPYSSRITRETTTSIDNRVYRENAAWQAWKLGGDVPSKKLTDGINDRIESI